MKIKREVCKKLSTQLLEWSKEPELPTFKDLLEKEDAGIVLTRKNGILKIFVSANTEEEALNLLVDLITSNFSDYAYNILLDKFPKMKEQIESLMTAAIQNLDKQEALAMEQQPQEEDEDEEEPLVNPLMPRG